jgi:hypothetical protein
MSHLQPRPPRIVIPWSSVPKAPPTSLELHAKDTACPSELPEVPGHMVQSHLQSGPRRSPPQRLSCDPSVAYGLRARRSQMEMMALKRTHILRAQRVSLVSDSKSSRWIERNMLQRYNPRPRCGDRRAQSVDPGHSDLLPFLARRLKMPTLPLLCPHVVCERGTARSSR